MLSSTSLATSNHVLVVAFLLCVGFGIHCRIMKEPWKNEGAVDSAVVMVSQRDSRREGERERGRRKARLGLETDAGQ